MALTQQDIDTIDLRAGAIARAAITDALVLHVAGCPHGKALAVTRAKFAGLVAGLALAGASTGFTLAKLLI